MPEPSLDLQEAAKVLRRMSQSAYRARRSPYRTAALEAGADALEQLQAGHGCPVTVTGLDHGDGKCVLACGHAGDHLTRQEIDHTRDRLADLEVHAAELQGALAELFDLLHTLTLSPRERANIDVREPQEIEARVRAALQADAPPRGRVVLGYQTADGKVFYAPEDIAVVYALDPELQRHKRVVEAARFADADAPDPWRSKSDAANQLRRALAALDPEPQPQRQRQRQPRP